VAANPRCGRTLVPVTTRVQPRPGLGDAYWRLWWANAVDNAGDGALAAALPLLAATITRDPRLVSAVSVAAFLPWLPVSLPAGALVDRHDRAGLMWRAQLIQGAVVTVIAVLVAVHHVSVWALAAGGLCLGSAQVVFDNASQSVLPLLVQKDLLPRANGSLYVVVERHHRQHEAARSARRGVRPGQQRLPDARLGHETARRPGRRIRRARRRAAGTAHRRRHPARRFPSRTAASPARCGPGTPDGPG
jgi:hypothetical protein